MTQLEFFEKFYQATGSTLTDAQIAVLKEIEVEIPDVAVAPIFDKNLNDFKKNIQKGIHDLYDIEIDEYSDVIGLESVSKVKSVAGQKKLATLKENIKKAIEKSNLAIKEEDPEALKKANDTIVELQAKVKELDEKYTSINVNELNDTISNYKNKYEHSILASKFKDSNLVDEFKSTFGIKVKIAELEDYAKKYKYILDIENWELTDEDGQPVSKNSKQMTIDRAIDEVVGEQAKKGQDAPPSGVTVVQGVQGKALNPVESKMASKYGL